MVTKVVTGKGPTLTIIVHYNKMVARISDLAVERGLGGLEGTRTRDGLLLESRGLCKWNLIPRVREESGLDTKIGWICGR